MVDPRAPAGPGAAAKGLAMTRTRIVALTLIGVVALGLAYLKLGSADDRPSVPAGALAGDLLLEPCTYSTENGSYAADCGTLVVPENRADPQSRLIALPVTRIRSLSDHPAEPVVWLKGGPGLTNTDLPWANRFAEDRDVVLVGYRGMDGSSVLDCPEVESALKRSTDFLGERSFRERSDAFRACADRLSADGVDLAGYSLPQRVDDELCEMLAKYHPMWINLHFNHPNEITPEVSRAVGARVGSTCGGTATEISSAAATSAELEVRLGRSAAHVSSSRPGRWHGRGRRCRTARCSIRRA